MITFFKMGGYSMLSVLLCGLAGLLVALYASGRPSDARIKLAERLIKAEIFFAVAGYASNVAATLHTVSNTQHQGDGMWTMLFTGLYESTAPVIMGFSFIALIHVALAVAAHRQARRHP
jgi:hypothetical protein